jgi:hypothetical protein
MAGVTKFAQLLSDIVQQMPSGINTPGSRFSSFSTLTEIGIGIVTGGDIC